MGVKFKKYRVQNWELINDRIQYACMSSAKETVKLKISETKDNYSSIKTN